MGDGRLAPGRVGKAVAGAGTGDKKRRSRSAVEERTRRSGLQLCRVNRLRAARNGAVVNEGLAFASASSLARAWARFSSSSVRTFTQASRRVTSTPRCWSFSSRSFTARRASPRPPPGPPRHRWGAVVFFPPPAGLGGVLGGGGGK